MSKFEAIAKMTIAVVKSLDTAVWSKSFTSVVEVLDVQKPETLPDAKAVEATTQGQAIAAKAWEMASH
eukprot:5318069-Alexandrium_andersonii.AAC.1